MTAKAQGTLEAYESSEYGKEVVLAPAKIGKTVTLLGNALGVFPWQEHGGVISDPSCLHVVTFDASALGGAMDFLINEAGASKEIGKTKVYNLQAAARKAFASQTEYDGTFAQTVYETVSRIQDESVKGNKVHALIFSSLTMCAKAWLRGISGPAMNPRAAQMKKSPMDQNKWGLFAQQMTEFQFFTQTDTYHTIWETHWAEKESKTQRDASGNAKVYDTIQVQGATAVQFPAQCERVYMLSRKKGPWNGDMKSKTKVNLVEFDTQPNLDFGESMMAGRSVVGVLEPKETDLTKMFHKLGLRIGCWGAE